MLTILILKVVGIKINFPLWSLFSNFGYGVTFAFIIIIFTKTILNVSNAQCRVIFLFLEGPNCYILKAQISQLLLLFSLICYVSCITPCFALCFISSTFDLFIFSHLTQFKKNKSPDIPELHLAIIPILQMKIILLTFDTSLIPMLWYQ